MFIRICFSSFPSLKLLLKWQIFFFGGLQNIFFLFYLNKKNKYLNKYFLYFSWVFFLINLKAYVFCK